MMNKIRLIKDRFFIKKKINQYLKRNSIKLDLGSAASKRDNFISVDISGEADINWDLTKGIPFPSESVEIIRSDHFFEHLYLDEVVFVMKECHRVLKKNGILDFTVPHINPYLEAYKNKDIQFLKQKINDVPQDELYETPFDRISWLLHRKCEHRSMFDEDAIKHKVSLAGFNEIKIRDYDEKFDMNFRFSSIYVHAIK